MLHELARKRLERRIARMQCRGETALCRHELVRAVPNPIPALWRELCIVMHADLSTTARVRAFFDIVGCGLAAERDLLRG